MKFPNRIDTEEEMHLVRSLIEKGHRHRLKVTGSSVFRERLAKSLSLVKLGGYYDFLRTYIKAIVEIQGFSQLRQAESEIWANLYTLENAIEGACFLVQKAFQMKMFLNGELYYDIGETEAIRKRLEFLGALAKKSRDPSLKEECEERLRLWDQSKFL